MDGLPGTYNLLGSRGAVDKTRLQAFEEHVKKIHSSSEFKEVGRTASHFLNDIRDFIFGRPATLENAVRLSRAQFCSQLTDILT